MPGRAISRPAKPLRYHVWRDGPDTRVLSDDKDCAYYLERPMTAGGRLSASWDYKLQLGDLGQSGTAGVTVMTIRKEETSAGQLIHIVDASDQVITSLRWVGDAKKRRTGKVSGTKKYTFDWQGRELVWDSRTQMAGTDHFCVDPGSGAVLCYFRSVFMPLAKDGKVELDASVRDETTRLVLLASCLAYREWADKRQTAVYV